MLYTVPPSRRALEVFFAALDKLDPAGRAAYLDEACRDNKAMRGWVVGELRRQTGHGTLLSKGSGGSRFDEPGEEISPEAEALLAALKPEEPGDLLGAYRLLSLLGEGGFGVVWMAQQESPVRRKVALKVLKLGMNTRQIMGRFEQERQTLASLDHPGIAKVFDAGTTANGRPYFAMELIAGEPITDFCDDGRFSLQQRLELFMRVCFAVQHAHQKAIIHRDLKPSNVLVTVENDGSAAPKVIDLGLAKFLDSASTDHTMVMTMEHALIGTPLYMSPEQAEGSHVLDTRSDVYSLGVILYELLTGRTPHLPANLAKSDEQIRRAIREHEPARPSSAVRTMSEGPLSAVAQQRDTQPTALLRTLRGELDAICLKALEKDPNRRYSSAAAFATDIRHYLLHEPIAARPPSQWYRAKKFARRNRRTVLAAGAVFLAILLGLLVSVQEAWRARAAEAEAAEQRDRAEGQRRQAERDRAAAKLSEYVADVGLAQQSLQSGNLGRALYLLEKHRAQPGEPDHRGWAWDYLWRLAQGDERVSYAAHPGPALALAYAPGGDFLAVGGQQATTICDAKTRRLVTTLNHGARWLAFLPDGRTLITLQDQRLTLWNTVDWSEFASWEEGGRSAALSPDGSVLALAAADGVRIRDTQTWREKRKIAGVKGALAFSPDGGTLAAVGGAGIGLRSLKDEAEPPRWLAGSENIFQETAGALFSPQRVLAFALGGRTIVAGENHITDHGAFVLRTWDTATGVEQSSLPDDPERPEHTGAISALAVAADGATLATTSLDHSVRLWDLKTHRRLATLQGHRAETRAVAFSPDGRHVATCDRLGQVNEWPVRAAHGEDALTGVDELLSFSKDGQTFADASHGAIEIRETATKKVVKQIDLLPAVTGQQPVFATDEKLRVFAAGLRSGAVKIWQWGQPEPQSVKVSEHAVNVIALSPDGKLLLAGSAADPLKLHDLQSGKTIAFPFSASRVVISADGRSLAALIHPPLGPEPRPPGLPVDASARGPAASDKAASPLSSEAVVVCDLPSGKTRARIVSQGYLMDVAFSRDGRMLATVGTDNAVRLWNAESGEPLGMLIGHKQIVRAVAFSIDGRTLATASDDSTVRFWNLEARQELFSLTRVGRSASRLAFSNDNCTLAMADPAQDGTLEVSFLRAPQPEGATAVPRGR